MLKKFAKKTVVSILGRQTRQLLEKNPVKLVAVVGSMGKTSTKRAIATVLGQQFRVQYQDGNYNDILTVPLVLFGHANPPNLTSPLAWIKIFLNNQKQLKTTYPYDVAVLELGTDSPGDIAAFGAYLQVDIAVITAIAPEHMEFFADLDAVAAEELAVSGFSDKLIANKDLCGQYLEGHDVVTYGLRDGNLYLSDLVFSGSGYSFGLHDTTRELMRTELPAVAETELYCVLAAVAVARHLKYPTQELLQAVKHITPAPGRMRRLDGVDGSVILDDTYNSSPEAAKAALKTLYQLQASSRVALLGNMNELGAYSESAHRELGDYCDPDKLDLLVTLGPDANAFLAPAASAKGIETKLANTPYEAAEYLRPYMKQGTVLLAKGSQNGVYAEEAVKQLLADSTDTNQLVRQSAAWLAKKSQQFPPPTSGASQQNNPKN